MTRTTLSIPSLLAAALLPFATQAGAEGKKVDPATASIYEDVIRPIFADRCDSCHGEKKNKGKLRLHTPEDIQKGGGDGEIIAAGKKDDSPLFQRIGLPEDDEDVMPPEDKPRLTAEEKLVIGWWIDQGASFDKKIADMNAPDDIKAALGALVLAEVGTPGTDAPKVAQPAAADPATLESISNSGVLIMPLAQDTTFLAANAINVSKSFGDEQLKQLAPASTQLQWLDLAKTQVTDAGMVEVGKLGALTRLHLENTAVTDAALAEIGKLANLEYLNLYGTKVTDAGLAQLANLKNLKKIYLWQTGVTEDGAKKLEQALPGVEVNLGWKEPAAAAPAEPAAEEKKA